MVQATWKTLNLESDNEEEDEIDDTKEIQIEEALKLYQAALKSQAEGPQSFDKTAEAYKALFESEVFKYTESLSEYKRHELYGDELVFDSILQDDLDAGPVQSTGGNESAPNTLPQILHLSYKNRGQFILEIMQYWIREHGARSQEQAHNDYVNAMNDFAEALDKEDTDLDLWLRTSSVATMLGSTRLTRYCLESVLDGSDELYESLLRLPGLEEGFAGQQVYELVSKLDDTLSLHQKPLSKLRKKKLSEALKKRLNPYPFAPPPAEGDHPVRFQPHTRTPERITLSPAKWDWAGVGEAILCQYMAEHNALVDNSAPGSTIRFDIPPDSDALDTIEGANVAGEIGSSNSSTDERFLVVTDTAVPLVDTTNAAFQNTERNTLQPPERAMKSQPEDSGSITPVEAVQAQSRKRSTDSAGFVETAENGRGRSKRLKARESDVAIIAESAGQENKLEDQLWPCTFADQCLHEVINDIFVRLGVAELGPPKDLRSFVTNSTPASSADDSIDRAAHDLYAALQLTTPKVAPVLLSAEPIDLGGASREAGLNAFLGYSKSSGTQTCLKPVLGSEKLSFFLQSIDNGWLSIQEVAFSWVEALLSPGLLSTSQAGHGYGNTSYVQYQWADDLKRHLVQIIVNVDDFIYTQVAGRLEKLNTRILQAREQCLKYTFSRFDAAQVEMIETLFELHLDIYSLIRHPHSGVDQTTQSVQSDRLERWISLAREAMQLRADCHPNIGMDDLALRHFWASIFQMNVNDDMVPRYLVYAMGELKDVFQSLGGRTLQVQNNAVMPELSAAAVDRELVRIGMKDFFLKVFETDEKDPVATIESLEPILEPTTAPLDGEDDHGSPSNEALADSTSARTADSLTPEGMDMTSAPSPVHEMRKFLDSASVNLRLSLWQRLREAYEAIEYQPKVLSCYLRSIETLAGEFQTSSYQSSSAPDRYVKLIRCFRIIDEVVQKALRIIKNEKDGFACLSYELMQSSMSAISQLLRIVSAGNILQDMVRIGQISVPRVEGLPPSTYANMVNRLNDMQVRLWTLQYYLLREGIAQTPKEFSSPSDDSFEFLRHVHHALGVRQISHASGRLFLRLAKDELLRLEGVTETNSRDTELSQVLYDLYGLKTFIDPQECQEFGSGPDVLDKKIATILLPFILSQAEKINIKDLSKHDLKATIERVHGALGRPKANEDISYNRKLLNTFFKSPIKPVSLFNCLKGVGSVLTKHIPTETSIPASRGWYFLMGNIALSKFRLQKRHVQISTEDLSFAQAFFLQDLEYSSERWETWYRLAQANDTQLEEAVSWNAEKLNNGSMELVTFQRAAIHCYSMAVACAVRDADSSSQTRRKVAQLYADFGNRMYASSREPFSMSAFTFKDNEKIFYSGRGPQQEIYQEKPFEPLYPYTAWKFASVLFKRAIQSEPNRWWNYYMLGKCLWKMYCRKTDAAAGPSWEEVIDAIIVSIETLPEKRERGREPILEPHYKLVSLVHKLVQRKAIDHTRGEQILENTHFSQNLPSPDGPNDWERYVLSVLKELRAADKTSWHHRIIARAAHVIYDDSNDIMVAHGAKHELTQQIFTKTMAVQVWKPENERPGRHFVYTTRYTKFFVHLLDQTSDKTNMEALARRVRRKQTDFFEHSALWQELCQRYVNLLRRVGQVPAGHEDSVFRTANYDEYYAQANRLEAWCQDPATQHPVLDILRDVVELKRVNNGLWKHPAIDELLGDTFALLYTTVAPTLPALPSEQPQPGANPAGHSGTGSLQSSTIPQMQVDGSQDGHNAPFNLFHPSQLLQQPDPFPKTRTKTVGKREVQRRGEACAQKLTAVVAPSTTAIPIRSPVATTHTSLVQSADKPAPEALIAQQTETSSFESGRVGVNDQIRNLTGGTATGVGIAANVGSAPPSVHDDADDESELSELDESEVQEIGQEYEANRRVPVPSRSLFSSLPAHKETVDETETEAEDVESSMMEDEQNRESVAGREGHVGKGEDVDMEEVN